MGNAFAENPDASSSTTKSQILPVPNATTPYWRTELHAIDEHRSTPDLPSSCDIAIIGAGMSGVATAYHLVQAASEGNKQIPSIVILEARQVCSGATGRNGGHSKIKVTTATCMELLRSAPIEMLEEVWEHVREQPYALKKVVEAEGLECEFELRRTIDAVLREEDAKEKKRQFLECLEKGYRWTWDTSMVEARYAEQITSLHNAKLAFTGPACSFWPYKFVSQLLSRLVSRNQVNLQTNTPVTSVTESREGLNILHTARGQLKAKQVIFATNAYSAGILPSYEGTIIPTRGTAVHITPKTPVSPHLSHTYNINHAVPSNAPERCDYLNPRPDGSIVVGGGQWTYSEKRSRWYNVWDDSTTLDEVRPHFEGYMQRYFRGWEESGAQLDSVWTGIMGTTPDGRPHVGEVPGSKGRRYIIAGFNGGGMSMIFTSTRGLARMIVEGVSFEKVGLPRLFKTTAERLR